MKKSLLIAIAMLAITVFIACTTKQVTESTINLQLQNSVDSIVKQDMKEFAAQEGMVIVMETSTDNLRAMAGWKEDNGKVAKDTTLLTKARETFLFRGVSLLAALETGKVSLDDMFHTYAGIDVIGQDTIYDHNWRKGGYGELTLLQGLAYNSSIAIDKAVDVAYQDKDVFLQKLQQMGLEKDSTFKGSWTVYALGFHHRRPTSMVSFFNAIANGGKKVSPKMKEGSTIVVDSMIAKKKNIESMQKALRFFVTNGLGKKAESKWSMWLVSLEVSIWKMASMLTSAATFLSRSPNTRYSSAIKDRRPHHLQRWQTPLPMRLSQNGCRRSGPGKHGQEADKKCRITSKEDCPSKGSPLII